MQLTKGNDGVTQFAWSPDGASIAYAIADPKPDLKGEDKFRTAFRVGNDDFSQPRALFRLFSPEQKQRLFSNYAEAMQGVPEYIIERQLALFAQVDPEYANGVRSAIDALRPEPVAGD